MENSSIFWSVLYIENGYILVTKSQQEDEIERLIEQYEGYIPDNTELFLVEQDSEYHKYMVFEYDSDVIFFDSYTIINKIPSGCIPVEEAYRDGIKHHSNIPFEWYSPLNKHWGISYPLEISTNDILGQYKQ